MQGADARFHLQESGSTCLLITAQGPLSWADRELLAATVESYLATRPEMVDVVVDLSVVPYVNSAGLGALFLLHREVRRRGGRLVFACTPPLIARAFRAVGLDRLARMEADVPGSLAHLAAPTAPPACEPLPGVGADQE